MTKSTSIKQVNSELIIKRLTGLWAFSEAAIGGILHAFRFPFKGIFIAGAAVIFISLIGYYSKNRGTILKSTFIVLVVKIIVSPHASVTAFGAVLFQGLLGELIFTPNKFKRYLPIIFGMLVLTISAIQKFIILTLIFGNRFWTSIDELAKSIYLKFLSSTAEADVPSMSLIITYTFIHLVAGFFAGWYALKIPVSINENIMNDEKYLPLAEDPYKFMMSKKKKLWWKKPKKIILLIFISGLLVSTYYFSETTNILYSDILFIVVRAIIFLLIWFFFLSPLIRKGLQLLIKKKQSEYLEEVEEVLNIFPALKIIFTSSYNEAKSYRGLRKIKFIIKRTFLLALTSNYLQEINIDSTNHSEQK
jgi:hypothetical protein